MAKVEEFILYSIVVFNVTLADGDEAHTVIFDVWSHFLRNWWIWVSVLALLWWLSSWAISTYSLYSIVIEFNVTLADGDEAFDDTQAEVIDDNDKGRQYW